MLVRFAILTWWAVVSTNVPSSVGRVSAAGGVAKGILEPSGLLFGVEAQSGFQYYRIELNWSLAEPSYNSYSNSYFDAVKQTISVARSAGLTPILSFGLEYPASWVFALDPEGSRFVNQYGDVWTGAGNGERVANGVFSSRIRAAMAGYIQNVFQKLGTAWGGVNWGGGLVYDEVRYPWCPTGRSNCFWAYDSNARAQNPVPGYTPATGNIAQAQTFATWYNRSLQNYITWGMGIIRKYYGGQLIVLLPSWGIRPGDIQNAVSANLNGKPYRSSEVAGGMDWASQLPAYAAYGTVTVDSTWANRLDDPWNDPQDWGPVHYLASILPTSMRLGGENSLGAAGVSDMNDLFNNARTYHLQWIMWMSESFTQIQGNATLQQIGAQ